MAKKPGKEPERLKVEGDWQDAVRRSLGVKKPTEGWPTPEPVPQRSPKKSRPSKG